MKNVILCLLLILSTVAGPPVAWSQDSDMDDLVEKHETPRNDVYQIFGEITAASVKRDIDKIGRMADKLDPKGVLTIILDSPGGSVTQGFALYDYLRTLPVPTIILVVGQASSMAAVVLQAGTLRIMGENATLLVHEINAIYEGKVSMQEDDRHLTEIMWKNTLGVLCSKSKLKPDEIKKQVDRKDWYLTAEEAKKLGLVDVVF